MGIASLHSQEKSLTQRLYDSYDAFKVREITSRRMKQADMMKVVGALRASMDEILSVEELGRSSEGRPISLLKLGTGKTKIFMWSQMHGDEPTATMGILDMLSFISLNKTSPEVRKILSETTLLIIPMVNPDGAERFQRRSVHGIDINRDALSLQTKEAQVLKATRDAYSPDFGFNLHDQEPRFTVGPTGAVATIALLAPAYDYAKSENASRLRAKKVAAKLVELLLPFIDGHISRYDDSFEPRAFGDNVQRWGTSTVLIESGGWENDREKMFIRKLNCVALLGICSSIARGDYEQSDVALYERLAANSKTLCDVILRGVALTLPNNMAPVVVDVGIDEEEYVDANGTIRRKGKIVEVGDLSTFSSFRMIDARGKSIDAASIKMESAVDLENLLSALKPTK